MAQTLNLLMLGVALKTPRPELSPPSNILGNVVASLFFFSKHAKGMTSKSVSHEEGAREAITGRVDAVY